MQHGEIGDCEADKGPPTPPCLMALAEQDGRIWALVERNGGRALLRWSGKAWEEVDTAERIVHRMDPSRAWAWEFSSDRRFRRARARLHRVMRGQENGVVMGSVLSDVTA